MRLVQKQDFIKIRKIQEKISRSNLTFQFKLRLHYGAGQRMLRFHHKYSKSFGHEFIVCTIQFGYKL